MDTPLDAPVAVHGWACPHCSASRAGFKTKKSAQSSKNRHIREKHKPGGSALAGTRRRRDARAHEAQRAHHTVRGTPLRSKRQRAGHVMHNAKLSMTSRLGWAAEYECFVLCPQRRHEMFQQTRAHLVQRGFHISKIKRREGIDLQKHTDIPRHQVITKYVLEYLRPELKDRFLQNPKLRYVFFAEDDCRLKPGKCARDARKAALAAGSKIGWLGYFIRNGAPRYGAHLLSFSSESLYHLDELYAASVWGALPAFDTVLYRLSAKNSEAIYVAPESIASQAAHALAGRR